MTDDEAPPPPEPTTMERLAKVVVDAFVKAKEQTAPTDHAARLGANLGQMETWEDEARPIAQSIIDQLGGLDNLPDGLSDLVGQAGDPEHAWSFVIQLLLFASVMVGVVGAMSSVGGRRGLNALWTQDPIVPLSPEECADASVRNVMSYAEAQQTAQQNGIDQRTFDFMVGLTGEPPGIMDMLKLVLRGDMPEDFFDQAVLYSRIKNEYLPMVRKLAYSQMSPADAIEAAIKQVVTMDEARALFARGGGLDSDFTTLFEAAGDSIAIQQVLTLWKYGLATETDVNNALGRSRINPMFYGLAKLTHFHPLSAFQISKAITAGTVTPAEGEKWLIQNGTPADQAHALATAHASGGTAKAHAETMSLIEAAYIDHVYSYAQANAALINIGYHPDVAALILEVADAKRGQSQTNHAVSVIRTNYLARRLTRTQAITDLDQLLIPADARDKWLAEWDLEQSAHPKTLTAVQLATAGKDGFLPPGEVFSRIVGEGYTAADAKVLMQLHKAPLPAGV